MTIGIYAIYWQEEDLIYIGQSGNIEVRFNEHQNKLKRISHSNYKVQDAYNKYGKPDYIIIEKCTMEQLNYLEILWTYEFSSMDEVCGLNIIIPGTTGGSGVFSGNSKYSKIQILKVFRLLSSSVYTTIKDISNIMKVSTSAIGSILRGESHVWLSEVYPIRYNNMLNRLKYGHHHKTYNKKYTLYYEGAPYTFNCIDKFSKANNLNSICISRVIKGTQSHHRGWYLNTLEIPKVLSPDGVVFSVPNITQFAKDHGLHQSHFNYMILGKTKQHKGWKLI